MTQDKIDAMLKVAWHYLGSPYIWGGDDPSGYDCSGLVLECLKSVGLVGDKEDLTAHGIWEKFKDHEVKPDDVDQTIETLPGDLCFYFNPEGRAYHVVICDDHEFQIGASGGDHTTTTIDAAWKKNAYVKRRPINFNPKTMKIVVLP